MKNFKLYLSSFGILKIIKKTLKCHRVVHILFCRRKISFICVLNNSIKLGQSITVKQLVSVIFSIIMIIIKEK